MIKNPVTMPVSRPLILILLPLILGLSCSNANRSAEAINATPEVPDWINPEFAKNKLWDDGLAEVAIYDAVRVIYGQPRNYEYVFATVKEAFNQEYQVKTDNYQRDDLFEVIKLNKFARIQTENYPYHFLTSVFHRREDPYNLYKMTVSSQEWCGNTFKEYVREKGGLNFVFHSYWDGQGDGEEKLKETIVFEDQLPYLLRAVKFEEGLSFTLPLASNQTNSRANIPQVAPAEIAVASDTASYPGEGPIQAWRVSVKGEIASTWWFATEYPHVLLKMEAADNRSLRLKSLRRWAYWER